MARTLSRTLRIGIAPSKDNPDLSPSQVRRDGRVVAGNRPHVLLTTEMGDGGRDLADFLAGMGGEYRPVRPTARSKVPVIFDRATMKQYPDSSTTIDIPNTSAKYICTQRQLAIARVAPRGNDGEPIGALAFTIIGGHYNAFAFSDHFKRQPSMRRKARSIWDRVDEATHDAVADQHRQGRLVIVGFDANRGLKDIPQFSPRQRVLITSAIDHVLVIPAPLGKGPTLSILAGHRNVTNVPGGDHHYRSQLVRIQRQVKGN